MNGSSGSVAPVKKALAKKPPSKPVTAPAKGAPAAAEAGLRREIKTLSTQMRSAAARARAQLLHLYAQMYRERLVSREAAVREEALRRSTTYQLGTLLRDALRSSGALMRLPTSALRIYRDRGKTEAQAVQTAVPGIRESTARQMEMMMMLNDTQGVEEALAYLSGLAMSPLELAHLHTQLAKTVSAYSFADACGIGEIACVLDPSSIRLKWLMTLYHRSGALPQALATAGRLPAQTAFNPAEKRLLDEIRQAPANKPKATHAKSTPAAKAAIKLPPDLPSIKDALEGAYTAMGAAAAAEVALRETGQMPARARAGRVIQAGRLLLAAGHLTAEFELAKQALVIDKSDATWRGFYWAAQRHGAMAEAYQATCEVERAIGPNPTPEQLDALQRLKASPTYQMGLIDSLGAHQEPVIEVIPDTIAYVLHNSLPHSSGGYATRGHGVAVALQECGIRVTVLTRPGYPIDIKPELVAADVEDTTDVDGVRYVRTLEPMRREHTTAEYMVASADALEKRFRQVRPALVIGASNYITALPALIAARRLGLPFIYEVRGFWEITRMSRDESYEGGTAFRVQKRIEGELARHANCVFTLTEAMREELLERGVPPEQVGLLPNSCDPQRFLPRPRDAALAARIGVPPGVVVIGYVGTFVDYEGLEDLGEACGLLKQRGVEFRLLMVGNENTSGQTTGPITEQMVKSAADHGYTDWLVLTGRVPHDEVESYYSLIDICPFPRKPWPVCEMVSPMKPLEALSMEKAVVVSSVRALVDMIRDRETGVVFTKGEVHSLADALQSLIRDPELRKQVGRNGRAWVEKERTWRMVGEKLSARCREIQARAPVAAALPAAGPALQETVPGRVLSWAETKPAAIALTFHGEALSYGELGRRMGLVATAVRASGLAPSDVALVFAPQGIEGIVTYFGLMQAGIVPSFMPLPSPKQDPGLYWSAHRKLLEVIRPAALVCPADTIQQLLDAGLDSFARSVLSLEQLQEPRSASVAPELDAGARPGDIALLQHSSGTTGLKKGVALTHEAILGQVMAYGAAIRAVESDVVVSWLPTYHDMGLIACTVQPLMLGQKIVLLDPFEWVASPQTLFEEIGRHRATLTWLPNFAFELLSRTVQPDAQRYDLRSMRAWIDCSEPCKPASLQRFAQRFAPLGVDERQLQVCYAMAETVFGVTQTPVGERPRRLRVTAESLSEPGPVRLAADGDARAVELVSAGRAIDGIAFSVLDAEGRPVDERLQGEIELQGDFLFHSYYRRPDATAARMRDGRYRTGDVGFVDDGELFVLGRADDLIIVHGRNYFAHEIEAIANDIDGLKPGRNIAVAVPNDMLGSLEIVLIAECEEGRETDDALALKREIKQAVLQAMGLELRDVALVPQGWLIKTTSGKIGRAANLDKYVRARQERLTEKAIAHAQT